MRVGELFNYAPKSQIKAGDAVEGAEYMFFTSSADETKRYPEYQLDGEGIIMGTGGNATLHYYSGKFATSTDCVVLLPNSQIKCKYLYYFFRANMGILEAGFKGAGLRHTNKKYINDISIKNIPNHDKQDEVISTLDKLQGIIEARNKELILLDEIIKARFVELFGTLHDNENGFDIVTIEDVCSLIKDGTHQTPQYTEDIEEGFKFLSSKDVMSQKIDWTDIKYIPAELHEKLYATIKPQRNDILMSKNGVNYGVAAVNDTDEVFDIYVSLALLRPEEMIDPVFFRCVINNPETKRQFDSSIKGIGVPNLHLGEIKKTKIILPPMELQKEFVNFVKQVDKSKVAIQKSLEKTQLLFDSLMQKYFG